MAQSIWTAAIETTIYVKKRDSVGCEPSIRTALDEHGIARSHVPSRAAVCTFPSLKPEQRIGGSRLFEHLLLDNHSLSGSADARLVSGGSSVLEMRVMGGSTVLAAAEKSRSITIGQGAWGQLSQPGDFMF